MAIISCFCVVNLVAVITSYNDDANKVLESLSHYNPRWNDELYIFWWVDKRAFETDSETKDSDKSYQHAVLEDLRKYGKARVELRDLNKLRQFHRWNWIDFQDKLYHIKKTKVSLLIHYEKICPSDLHGEFHLIRLTEDEERDPTRRGPELELSTATVLPDNVDDTTRDTSSRAL